MIKNSKKKTAKSALIFYSCWLAIPCLQFLIFWVGVNFNSILLAFKDYNKFTGEYTWVAFKNFSVVWQNLVSAGGILGIALKNSVIVYLVATLIETPLTIFFAYYIFKKMPLSKIFRILLFIPSIISAVVLVTIFMKLADSGVAELLRKLTGDENAVGLFTKPNTVFPTVLFYHVWISFGSILLVYSSTMSGISNEVIEAAQIDGANSMQELFFVVIPQIFPTLSTYLVIGIVAIFTDQANLYTFFRDGAAPENYTIGYYLFIKVMGSESSVADYPEAAAMGLLFTAVAIPVTFGVKALLEKLDPNN